MKERPILFSGEMVRAILDGRKTQTRRVAKNPEVDVWLRPDMFTREYVALPENGLCPHGYASDRLWVKETHAKAEGDIIYRASDSDDPLAIGVKWKPSIFMRREYSRITLEITGVRVERLNDISEVDAIAEGVEIISSLDHGSTNPVAAYAQLWESINGVGSWFANPWVWVIEFKQLQTQA